MNKKVLSIISVLALFTILVLSLALQTKVTYQAQSQPASATQEVDANKKSVNENAVNITKIVAIAVTVAFFAITTILFATLRIMKLKKDKLFDEKAKVEREIRDKRHAERLSKEKK